MAASLKPFKNGWKSLLNYVRHCRVNDHVPFLHSMTRREIYHLSSRVSLSRLMLLRFTWLFLCLTKCHESCSASESGPQRRTSKCQTWSQCLWLLLSPKAEYCVILFYLHAECHPTTVSAAHRKRSALPWCFWGLRNCQSALGTFLGQCFCSCRNTQLAFIYFFFPDYSLCFKLEKKTPTIYL